MALTKFTKNVNNIQALSDRPNTIDGLSSDELKERYDRAGADIKEYLNDSLVPELDEELAKIPGENDYVKTDDSRLTNSRTCNNNFDNWNTARTNLKIGYGTSLPSSGDNGSIFFLYK